MSDRKIQDMVVTSKKMVQIEKGEGQTEKKFRTVLSNTERRIIIEENWNNDLIMGETVQVSWKQSQTTLIKVKKNE